jgi:ribonuclease-3
MLNNCPVVVESRIDACVRGILGNLGIAVLDVPALHSDVGCLLSERSLIADEALEAAQRVLGHRFTDLEVLALALTHASTAEERAKSNERLEFLGDSVLGLVVVEMIYRRYPEMLEGEMTKIKSMVVSRETCAGIAVELGLDRLLVTGKGVQGSGRLPASIAAAALESLVGAFYVDAGFGPVSAWITPLVEPIVERAATSGHQRNFKSVLQNHAQQELGATPRYVTLDEKGPDHAKAFKVCVELDGRRFEACWGQTKKKAEQEAALAALRELGIVEDDGGGGVRVSVPDGAPDEE